MCIVLDLDKIIALYPTLTLPESVSTKLICLIQSIINIDFIPPLNTVTSECMVFRATCEKFCLPSPHSELNLSVHYLSLRFQETFHETIL